jgi:hypothetical protein
MSTVFGRCSRTPPGGSIASARRAPGSTAGTSRDESIEPVAASRAGAGYDHIMKGLGLDVPRQANLVFAHEAGHHLEGEPFHYDLVPRASIRSSASTGSSAIPC